MNRNTVSLGQVPHSLDDPEFVAARKIRENVKGSPIALFFVSFRSVSEASKSRRLNESEAEREREPRLVERARRREAKHATICFCSQPVSGMQQNHGLEAVFALLRDAGSK